MDESLSAQYSRSIRQSHGGQRVNLWLLLDEHARQWLRRYYHNTVLTVKAALGSRQMIIVLYLVDQGMRPAFFFVRIGSPATRSQRRGVLTRSILNMFVLSVLW